MTSRTRLIGGAPRELSIQEINEFAALVRAGGEVAAAGVNQRIRSAARLAGLYVDEALSAVAALKNPQDAYRRSVAEKAGFVLSKHDFPYELGYVYVMPGLRGRRFSLEVTREALSAAKDAGVFATTRLSNAPMQATLAKFGFRPCGTPYASSLNDEQLQLYVRSPRAISQVNE